MSVYEIRILPLHEDQAAVAVAQQASLMLEEANVEVETSQVVYIDGATREQALTLTEELFENPVTNIAGVVERRDWDDDNHVEVAPKPGVLDPAALAIGQAANILGIGLRGVATGTQYDFSPATTPAVRDRVVDSLLVNKTIQTVRHEPPASLQSAGEVGPVTTLAVRGASLEELEDMSDKNSWHLDRKELSVMQQYFRLQGRDPTDCEAELLAARWSEHCGHKTFNAKLLVNGEQKAPLFTRLKETARRNFGENVVSAFDDNSGVIRFYDGWCIAGKVETHNSPSALEPYGGAMTGSGGVFRDIAGTGLGAKNILSTDMFCFGRLKPANDGTYPHAGADYPTLPEGCLAPEYLQKRVVDGVRDYGNRMGIPTANGSVHYHDDFRARPSVIVGAYGLMREEHAGKREPLVGDLVIAVGGRTGRDGIHGATFSSGSMTAETATINSSAVQIGDAIQEKKLFDALLEARDAGLIRAITDCGAAGFSSAIGEMAEHVGVDIDLAKAPLKYEGLSPWEIWLSESQERMVLALDPQNLEALQAICNKHSVEMANLGTFDGSNRLKVRYGSQVVADLDYDFLNHGLPQREMIARWVKPAFAEHEPEITDWVQTMKQVLAHGNVCSKEPIVRQYDHRVQGATVLPPFSGVNYDGPNDAVVLAPVLGERYGFVQAHGMNPVLHTIDPYRGSLWAIAEAMSNYVAVGGNPRGKVAFVNNYITPIPDEQTMGAVDQMVDAVCDAQDVLGIPVVSGKDSMSGTRKGKDGEADIHIPPTLTMSVMGGIEDIGQTVTADIKQAGSTLVLVGKTDYGGMGGSVLYDVIGGQSGSVPNVDLYQLRETLYAVHGAIRTGKVLACHDVSEGGLLAAVAEMSFGGDTGFILSHDNSVPLARKLFNETAGCFVVEVEDAETAKELFKLVPHELIGITTPQADMVIYQDGAEVCDATLEELKTAWQAPMREFYA